MTITALTKPLPAPVGRRWNPESRYGRIRAELLKTEAGCGFHLAFGASDSDVAGHTWVYKLAKELGIRITVRKTADGWDVWRIK